MKILIADDNSAVRQALRNKIESHPGWTVCAEAENGAEAVELAKQSKPDLVLLDLAMPDMNGLTAASIIFRALPGTTIFLFTLYDSPTLEEHTKRLGIQRVISKNEHHTLIPAIEEFFAQRTPPGESILDQIPAPTPLPTSTHQVPPSSTSQTPSK